MLDLEQAPADLFVAGQPAANPSPAPAPSAPASAAPVAPPAFSSQPVVREQEVVASYDGPAQSPPPSMPVAPFKPRRNVGKLLTIASAVIGIILIAAIGAIVAIGPDTLGQHLGLSPAPVPLVIEMTRKPDRRETASGNELLAVTGRIVNPTAIAQTVRDIRAELRDTQGRTVYSWTITRPVPLLAPGATADFDSAAVDIPRGAKNLHLSFIGPTGN